MRRQCLPLAAVLTVALAPTAEADLALTVCKSEKRCDVMRYTSSGRLRLVARDAAAPAIAGDGSVIAYAHDGRVKTRTRHARRAHVARTSSGTALRPLGSLALSPDGRTLLLSDTNGWRAIDRPTGRVRRVIGEFRVTPVFSPHGQALTWSEFDNYVRIRDLASGAVRRFRFDEAVMSVAWAPEGLYVQLADTVITIDPLDGRELRRITSPAEYGLLRVLAPGLLGVAEIGARREIDTLYKLDLNSGRSVRLQHAGSGVPDEIAALSADGVSAYARIGSTLQALPLDGTRARVLVRNVVAVAG